ncbi:hypothetical protein [Pseudomonas sp.]|uniref:hypothetical protein n=1 Tax=Pseudomonas sp. TaxID=306 RepID=UPI003BB52395
MLRPINKTGCAGALRSTQKMIQSFALWLCDPNTYADGVTEPAIEQFLQTPQEAKWLWRFLNGTLKEKTYLERAKHLAGLAPEEKTLLKKWIECSVNIGIYFDVVPTGQQIPTASPFAGRRDGELHWKNFKDLMEAFYLKGLREGLAYSPDGAPTEDRETALNYTAFRANFIEQHQFDKHEYARKVCVICNGELRNPSVDHWVAKANYPLLSVCADNLIPICGECNQSPNKGTKTVHTDGDFEDWFHPYFRHPNGTLKLVHQTSGLRLKLTSTRATDTKRVANLNGLFNLEQRWTREFKGEYRKLYNSILTRQKKRGIALTLESLCQQLEDWADGLDSNQPHFEVHEALAKTLLDANRLVAWCKDLNIDLRPHLLGRNNVAARSEAP